MKKFPLLLILLANYSYASNETKGETTKTGQLKEEIHSLQVQESNLNIQAQEYMFGQPNKYVESIHQVEKIHEEVQELQEELDALQEKQENNTQPLKK